MICSDCHHAIVRKFNNGQDEFEAQVVCGVDHFVITSMRKSISECSRMERKVVRKVCLHHATLEAGGTLRSDRCTVCGMTIDEIRGNKPRIFAKKSEWGTDKNGVCGPILDLTPTVEWPDKPKYKGWPKGKPRGKRGTRT